MQSRYTDQQHHQHLQQQQQQQQTIMHQAILQQQHLYHSGVLAAATMPQMEPIPSGNLPPGFDSSSCRSVYVGNIHPNVTENLLAEVFQSIGSLEGCKLIRKEKDIQMQIIGGGHEKNRVYYLDPPSDTTFYGDGGQDIQNDDAPENNPAYTTVYVGNLAHEVTQAELHRQFHNLGGGVIEEVRIQREKAFGFVRYQKHDEAALAIQLANGRIVCGKSMKCSWGTKPTPPGTVSNPLPPPGPPFQLLPQPGLNHQGYSQAELFTYQRQLALSEVVAAGSLAAQQGMGVQPSGGLGSSGSQGMYNGYAMNTSAAQQLMYYH